MTIMTKKLLFLLFSLSFTCIAQISEAEIINEIKSLLKEGTMPRMGFNQWVDTYAPVLLSSPKEPVKKLGETLEAIRQGNTSKISAFSVLPDFDKAVQAYDPQFKRSILGTPRLVAKGTYWYFSSPKK
ncbi:MAG: hypothetical protein K2X90_02230 [Candidatus Babeliaceae bacterium]|nr:hypothetical protein [Candidatus Babeliaceae bacterium]